MVKFVDFLTRCLAQYLHIDNIGNLPQNKNICKCKFNILQTTFVKA